jgi:hypothetical protein
MSRNTGRGSRQDANHSEVVDGLRKVGAHVTDTSAAGDGFPDLVVGFRGRWFVIEVKDGSLPPSERVLTPKQKKWHAEVQGHAPAHVANSLADALLIIGAIKPQEAA